MERFPAVSNACSSLQTHNGQMQEHAVAVVMVMMCRMIKAPPRIKVRLCPPRRRFGTTQDCHPANRNWEIISSILSYCYTRIGWGVGHDFWYCPIDRSFSTPYKKSAKRILYQIWAMAKIINLLCSRPLMKIEYLLDVCYFLYFLLNYYFFVSSSKHFHQGLLNYIA